MPCPLFEPLRKVTEPRTPSPRLPLLYEFEGICHAGETDVSPDHRFHYCNRGNAQGNCASFPEDYAISAIRFSVTSRTPQILTVLMLEEHNHWPGARKTIEFLIEQRQLQPQISDICRHAQILNFCVSYLEKTK